MNDTTPRAEALFRELMMKRSPLERFEMGLSMFDAAREMMVAGIKAELPNIGERELRAQIFLRTYGNDLPEARIYQVLLRIRGGASGPVSPDDRPQSLRSSQG